MDDSFVVIYAARTATDAHQLKNLLAEAGIRAEVTNTVLEGGAGVELLGWPTLARVVVAGKDAERARQTALEFDRKIAAMARAPAGEDSESEPPPTVPEAWPRCPRCFAPRVTKCPICGTTGVGFAQADPEYVGTPGLADDAQPTSCGCGTGGCSGGSSAAAAEDGLSDATGGEVSQPTEPEAAGPELMLVCPTCDEPFVPQYALGCPVCYHEFPDGFAPDPPRAAREPIGPRTIAVVLGLVGLVVAVFVYFAMLF